VGQSTWNKYEAGTRLPPPYAMAAFCEMFGCSMDWLYRGRPGGIMDPELERRLQSAVRPAAD